jgi:hypothetical protein
MHHLHSTKISLTLFFVFLLSTVKAQYSTSSNLPDHDNNPYYFGILLGTNRASNKLTYHPSFRDESSKVGSINSIEDAGFQFGLYATLQLSKRFELRFYPVNLFFSQPRLEINFTDTTITKQAPLGSVTMSFPLQVRFRSDRINNFRVYSLAGIKYDYLLSTNNDPGISIPFKRSDFGVETGIGFQFFFPYFILSPEIKYSYGISNIHNRKPNEEYSKLINRMSNRMIMFSLHFEGGIFNF